MKAPPSSVPPPLLPIQGFADFFQFCTPPPRLYKLDPPLTADNKRAVTKSNEPLSWAVLRDGNQCVQLPPGLFETREEDLWLPEGTGGGGPQAAAAGSLLDQLLRQVRDNASARLDNRAPASHVPPWLLDGFLPAGAVPRASLKHKLVHLKHCLAGYDNTLKEQYNVIGNAVAPPVAAAIGVCACMW